MFILANENTRIRNHPFLLTTQNARAVVYCVECGKLRVFIPRANLTKTDIYYWLSASEVLSTHVEHFYFHHEV